MNDTVRGDPIRFTKAGESFAFCSRSGVKLGQQNALRATEDGVALEAALAGRRLGLFGPRMQASSRATQLRHFRTAFAGTIMPTLANVPLSYGVLSVSALRMLTRAVGQPMICATICC